MLAQHCQFLEKLPRRLWVPPSCGARSGLGQGLQHERETWAGHLQVGVYRPIDPHPQVACLSWQLSSTFGYRARLVEAYRVRL